MPKDGNNTKQKILDKAHDLVLNRGFAGTSIDMVLEAAGITKGAFFYHFKNKAELATALAKRYAEMDDQFFSKHMKQAEMETDDPLDRLIRFLDLVADAFATQPSPPGCLFASFCYEAHQFESSVAQFMDEQMKRWRGHYSHLLKQIAKTHPPSIEIDLAELSDHFLAAVEGGFVMSRLYNDPQVVATHLRHFRRYVLFVFDR